MPVLWFNLFTIFCCCWQYTNYPNWRFFFAENMTFGFEDYFFGIIISGVEFVEFLLYLIPWYSSKSNIYTWAFNCIYCLFAYYFFFGFGSIDKKTSGLLLINSGFCKTQPIYLAIQIFPFCSYLLNMFDRQNNYKQIWNWHTNTTWCEMFKMLLQ